MTGGSNKVLVGRILFISAVLMLATAALVWYRVIPVADPARTYMAAALGAVAIVDMLMALFFVKGGS